MNRVARIGAAGAVLFAVGTGEARANPIPAPPWYENPVVLGAAVAGGVGIAALVVWALVSDRSAASDRVAFSEEDVTVRLEPTSALVTGRYAFRATGAAPARMAIRYPFPADPHLGAIRDVTVLDPTGRALPWAWHGDIQSKLWAIASGFGWAAGTVSLKHYQRDRGFDMLTFITWQMALGALPLAALPWFHDVTATQWSGPDFGIFFRRRPVKRGGVHERPILRGPDDPAEAGGWGPFVR